METLSKQERLYKKKSIESLYAHGKSIKTPAVICLYHPAIDDSEFPVQALFTAPKRRFARAHDRNRIKRLMKEVYRKEKQALYDHLNNKGEKLALAFIFTGNRLPDFDYVEQKIKYLIRQLISVTNQEQSKHENT
jgi:ribonuclease P protein component